MTVILQRWGQKQWYHCGIEDRDHDNTMCMGNALERAFAVAGNMMDGTDPIYI